MCTSCKWFSAVTLSFHSDLIPLIYLFIHSTVCVSGKTHQETLVLLSPIPFGAGVYFIERTNERSSSISHLILYVRNRIVEWHFNNLFALLTNQPSPHLPVLLTSDKTFTIWLDLLKDMQRISSLNYELH